ncbi:hypothetical protein [Embleya sp. NPDC050493]|uniref:hypothetical protein n=1 Tax=Embleya sp. NPDC050493 TaxID=3363989 RepID=UPI00379E0A06
MNHTINNPGLQATSPGTARPVPRWAENLAHLIPLLALPVCLWRLPIAFGYRMGMDEPGSQWSLWLTIPYVFGLSVLTEGVALLYFALVRGWGEVVPDRVPVLGGRRIPPFAVIVPASLGALVFTALLVDWVVTTFGIAGASNVHFTNGWWEGLATVVSGLFVLWGPLMFVQIRGYYVRRCRPAAPARG